MKDKYWSKVDELVTLPTFSTFYAIASWVGLVWHCVVCSTYGGGVYLLSIYIFLIMSLKKTLWYMSVWLWWSHYVKLMPSFLSSYDVGCVAKGTSMWMTMLGLV